jgi:phosphoribosyl-dephospho-CoA transferase
MTAALRRHDLVWPRAAGWQHALADADLDPEARDCLSHWAANDLPLVVTRQPAHGVGSGPEALLVLGLAAPLRWQRRRLFVTLRHDDVERVGAFPDAAAVAPLLAASLQRDWLQGCAALAAQGLAARVYGSHGWQIMSGLPCVHAGSDIDLLLHAATPGDADAAAALLHAAPFAQPRLDGEIVFADGAAVAWREWAACRAAWRAGRTPRLLVKHLHGAALQAAPWAEATA